MGIAPTLYTLPLVALVAAVPSSATEPVSPGQPQRFSGIPDPCPTFSWTPSTEAAGYELVVYRLSDDSGVGPGEDERGHLEPVIRETLAPATSWTPDLDRCLPLQGRYAWFVRALVAGDSEPERGGWSRPRLFRWSDSSGWGGRQAAPTDAPVGPAAHPPSLPESRARERDEGGPRQAPSRRPTQIREEMEGAGLRESSSMVRSAKAGVVAYPGRAGVEARHDDPSSAGFPLRGVIESVDPGVISAGVYGESLVTEPAASVGVYGLSRAQYGAGVIGETTAADGIGVLGRTTTPSASGVEGISFASTGAGIGVYGQSSSQESGGIGGDFYGFTGVRAVTNRAGGRAGEFIHIGEGLLLAGCTTSPCGSLVFSVDVDGDLEAATVSADGSSTGPLISAVNESTSGSTAHGASAQSRSPAARGVRGQNLATSGLGIGVEGVSESPDGRGVFGHATATAGANAGVVGQTQSTEGRGVFAIAGTATGSTTGVFAQVQSPDGVAGDFLNNGNGDILRGRSASGEVFRVEGDGSVFADGSINCGLASGCFNAGQGADVAERIDPAETMLPGEVVEIDPDQEGRFRRSREAYSRLVAGVVSSQPAITLNNADLAGDRARIGSDHRPLLALAGRVPVRVNGEGGPISPGDLLVASSMPGVAMRCADASRCFGATLGKALQSFADETGEVLMLVLPN